MIAQMCVTNNSNCSTGVTSSNYNSTASAENNDSAGVTDNINITGVNSSIIDISDIKNDINNNIL